MTEKFMGYVTNNYSKGMVQFRLFGHHDGVEDEKTLPWAFVGQGSDNLAVAGVGKTNNLQPGCRLVASQIGGKDGSWVIGDGTVDRWGKGDETGLGSSQSDGTTHYPAVDKSGGDYCIPCENENSENGTRVKAKALDGRYNDYADGQHLDLSDSQYPRTKRKDA